MLLTKGTTTEGTKEVSAILGENLGKKMRPKPTKLIETLVQLADKRKDLVVLDFFAGTGTTGHAVSLLNKEDGGNRRFILCTNDESDIARRVCYPRVKAVIEGHKNCPDITGIPSNLRYYKTAFVPVHARPTNRDKILLTDKAAEMLCVRERTFKEIEANKTYRIYSDGRKRFTGIIYNEDAIDAFKEFAVNLNGEISVYVFSFGDEDFSEEFADMRNKVKLHPIPERFCASIGASSKKEADCYENERLSERAVADLVSALQEAFARRWQQGDGVQIAHR